MAHFLTIISIFFAVSVSLEAKVAHDNQVSEWVNSTDPVQFKIIIAERRFMIAEQREKIFLAAGVF